MFDIFYRFYTEKKKTGLSADLFLSFGFVLRRGYKLLRRLAVTFLSDFSIIFVC